MSNNVQCIFIKQNTKTKTICLSIVNMVIFKYVKFDDLGGWTVCIGWEDPGFGF